MQPLSHAEQKVYLYLEAEGKQVFTVDELKQAGLGINSSNLWVIVHRLAKKRWLTRVKRGVYLRLPASAVLEGGVYLEDPFEAALKIFDGYLAFQSALRVHGLSEYEPFTVFVATKRLSRTVKLVEQYEVKAVKLGHRFLGFEEKNGYRVSTIAKTFFDCLMHPDLAGGYPEILKSLHKAGSLDWREFVSYYKRFGSSSLAQKTGYLLTLLRETGFRAPRFVMEYFERQVRVKTRLVWSTAGGKLYKEWLVTDNVGREKLLSWWLHG